MNDGPESAPPAVWNPVNHGSVWTDGPGEWEGSITFNDNSVSFHTGGSEVENTSFGGFRVPNPDNLFSDGPFDQNASLLRPGFNAKQIVNGNSGPAFVP